MNHSMHDWAHAEIAYRDTPQQALSIALDTGVTLDALYRHMHVRGIKKGHRVRKLPGQTKARLYLPDVVEAMIAEDNRSRDRAKLPSGVRYRCGECLALSISARCPNGHVVNPYLMGVA